MSGPATVLILSDPHFAGPAERARRGYELACAPNWVVRQLLALYRGCYWLRDPLGMGHFSTPFSIVAARSIFSFQSSGDLTMVSVSSQQTGTA